MDQLIATIGHEQALTDVCRELKFWAHSSGTSQVGAVYLSCSDESAQESAELFQRSFAQEMLPRLKHGLRAPFRLASPGARYEFGAVQVAEANFACADSSGAPKALLVKINSHVSVDRLGSEFRFGRMARYVEESHFCGALEALRTHSRLPFVAELGALFRSEGLDRIALLNDPKVVDLDHAPLLAAVCNARLQARCVTLDIQDFQPRSPTLYQIVHGVTLNRAGPDTELICGVYTIDRTGGNAPDRYHGLGDDPSQYRVSFEHGKLLVVDDQVDRPRAARDHRKLALESARSHPWPATLEDPRLAELRADVQNNQHHTGPYARAGLFTLITILIELAPLPTALVLLGEGLVAIHHAHRLNQCADIGKQEAAARSVLEDTRSRLDQLSPERARELLERLLPGHARRRSGV